MIAISHPSDDFRSHWQNLLKLRPEFHAIDTVLKRVTDISARLGVPYCAFQWYNGIDGDTSGTIRSMGVKRASLQIAEKSGADPIQAQAVSRLTLKMLPPCCNGKCQNEVTTTSI